MQLQKKKEGMDLKKTIAMVISNWYLFIICLIIAVAAAWMLNRYTVPVYHLKSTILVKESEESSPFATTGGISEQTFQGFALPGESANLYNQMTILRSRPIVEKTISELDFEVSYFLKGEIMVREIYTNSPFSVYREKNHPQLVNLEYTIKVGSDSVLQVEARGKTSGYTTLNLVKI